MLTIVNAGNSLFFCISSVQSSTCVRGIRHCLLFSWMRRRLPSQWKAEKKFALLYRLGWRIKKMFFCSIPRNRSLQQGFSVAFSTLLRWKTHHWPMQRNNRSMSWIINNNMKLWLWLCQRNINSACAAVGHFHRTFVVWVTFFFHPT